MSISFNKIDDSASGEYTESVRCDGRSTLGALKALIAKSLQVDVKAIRMRRAARGAHLKSEEDTLIGVGGAELTDGSAVYVEEGKPLNKSDVLVKAYLCEPTASSSPSSATTAAPSSSSRCTGALTCR